MVSPCDPELRRSSQVAPIGPTFRRYPLSRNPLPENGRGTLVAALAA
jgi:hypothetical protein